jgi:hypothetical protein
VTTRSGISRAHEDVSILGYDNNVSFSRDAEGMHIEVGGTLESEHPVRIKIVIDEPRSRSAVGSEILH